MKIQEYESSTLSKYELRGLTVDFFRDKYSRLMKTLAQHDYTIYHLSITWYNNSYNKDEYRANKNFKMFYLRNFVPLLIKRSRINKRNQRLQPICIACLDKSSDFESHSESSFVLPKQQKNCACIHHHSLIAAKDIANNNLEQLCGENTIKQAFNNDLERRFKCSYSKTPENVIWKKICTTDLKKVTTDIQYEYPFKNLYYFKDLPLTFNTKEAEEIYQC